MDSSVQGAGPVDNVVDSGWLTWLTGVVDALSVVVPGQDEHHRLVVVPHG
jgi:hypothetical protein